MRLPLGSELTKGVPDVSGKADPAHKFRTPQFSTGGDVDHAACSTFANRVYPAAPGLGGSLGIAPEATYKSFSCPPNEGLCDRNFERTCPRHKPGAVCFDFFFYTSLVSRKNKNKRTPRLMVMSLGPFSLPRTVTGNALCSGPRR